MPDVLCINQNTSMPDGIEWHGGIAYLDRDGVINIGSPHYVNSIEEVTLLDGAAYSIGELRRNGYKICITTNQSPISRGLWDDERLHSIHLGMQEMLLEIDPDAHMDLILACPHRYRDKCDCRKPAPGMNYLGHDILRGGLEVSQTPQRLPSKTNARSVNWWGEKKAPHHQLDTMVGDRRGDMGAGWAVGARLFRVNPNIGLAQVIDRILEQSDAGDDFDPLG